LSHRSSRPREHRRDEGDGVTTGSRPLVARDLEEIGESRMERLGVESIPVPPGDAGHPRSEAAHDDGRRRVGPQEARGSFEAIALAGETRGVARPEPAHDLDRLDDTPGPNLVAVDACTQRLLLDRIGRAPAAAGAEAEQQPSSRHRLKRRRHVGEEPGMAVRHVEHERPQRDSPRDLGERGQNGPRLRHARLRSRVGIAEMVPRPDAIESRSLGGQRRGPHLRVMRTHRDEQDVDLHEGQTLTS
jgi:hypothetical protein